MSRTQILLIAVLAAGIFIGFLFSEFRITPSNLPAYEAEKEKLEKELAGIPAPSERFVAVAKLVTPAVVNITAKGEQVTSVTQLHKLIPSIDLKGRVTLQLRSGNARKILQRGR